MKVSYTKVHLNIKFQSSVVFRDFPTFIFRSLLGKELRKLTCLFKDRICAECPLRFTCAYGSIFESHIMKNNDVLDGRNRASHPFVLFCNAPIGIPVEETQLQITLIGKAVEYLPYFYYSIRKAGSIGIFRERIPFKIDEARVNDIPLVIESDDALNLDFERLSWQFNGSESTNEQTATLHFLSPLRLKIQGRYTSDLCPGDLFRAIIRRASILISLYEEGDQGYEDLDIKDLVVPSDYSSNLVWKDLHYYSFRQQKPLKMGGAVGTMSITGLSAAHRSLLEFGELFHVGKNVSFGLGKIASEDKVGGSTNE